MISAFQLTIMKLIVRLNVEFPVSLNLENRDSNLFTLIHSIAPARRLMDDKGVFC